MTEAAMTLDADKIVRVCSPLLLDTPSCKPVVVKSTQYTSLYYFISPFNQYVQDPTI